MPLNDEQRRKLASIPATELSGLFHRNTTPKRQPLEPPFEDPIAREQARWHRAGDPWPPYAGDSPLASMYEIPRYTEVEPGVAPVEPTRRLSELHVDGLQVIDLANPIALVYLDLTETELTAGHGDDASSELCREIGDEIRKHRPDVEGILAPSAALSGGRMLVIFPHGFDRVVVGDQRNVKLSIVPAPPPAPAPRPPS